MNDDDVCKTAPATPGLLIINVNVFICLFGCVFVCMYIMCLYRCLCVCDREGRGLSYLCCVVLGDSTPPAQCNGSVCLEY